MAPRPFSTRRPKARRAPGPGAAALAIGLAIGLAAPAAAQEVLSAPETFDEFFVGDGMMAGLTQSFDGAAGQILVGVTQGRPSSERKLDLAAVRVAVPEGDGDRLCLSLSTTDGRYSATSVHPIADVYPRAPQLGLSTGYADALAGYSEAELLVRAERAARCDAGAESVATPAVATEGAGEIVASINIGFGRPKAWLERDGAPVTEKARCRRDEQAAKTHDCAIAAAGLSGPFVLVVDAGRLDGPSLVERTPIVLP